MSIWTIICISLIIISADLRVFGFLISVHLALFAKLTFGARGSLILLICVAASANRTLFVVRSCALARETQLAASGEKHQGKTVL